MDRSSFGGRVALITGASGGIGQAVARRRASGGAALGLGCGAHGQAAEMLAAEITSAAGGTAITVGADLRRPEDVLVSNAGLSHVQPCSALNSAWHWEIFVMYGLGIRRSAMDADGTLTRPGLVDRGH